MISKELLSEVLNKKVIDDDISNIEIKDNTLTFIEDYWDEDEGSGFYRNHTINIYELAHKCKEWITSKDYYLSTFIDFGVDNYFCKIKWFNSEYIIQNKKFIADTEPEAVFKAAQWVLDNVKTNSLP